MLPNFCLGKGFFIEATKTTVIGGKKIKEREGKLTKDLGMAPMKASQQKLDAYIDAAPNSAEKAKRVARVNLMKAHKKGLKAQGKISESCYRMASPTSIVVVKKYQY